MERLNKKKKVDHLNNADIILLSTKLVPQRTRVKLIERPRLVSLLDSQDSTPKLTVVFGPAGYGKSTLITQYIQRDSETLSAWYSLDDGDNNLAVFTQYFLAAYDLVKKYDASKLEPIAYQKSPSANPKARFTQLFNEIIAGSDNVRFVLDDFHLITNSRVREFIEWILKSMPEQMSLVLTSREKPNFVCLAEFAVQGNLVEIEAKQLKLSLEETENFLSSDKTVQLDKQTVNVLYERTEGWIAATQLALHALLDQKNQKEFVAKFSGSDKDIVSYLGSMVLSQQREEVQQFFLYTSVLKRLNASLCERVTGNPNAEVLLDKISNDGLFLFELDRDREWFRYHHLFGEFLLSRFKALESDKFKETALKAANWCLEQEDMHEAIDYYLMADHFEIAVKLMVENVSQLVQYQGYHEILLRWVDKLPLQYIRSEPRISICFAWSLIFTRNLEQVENVLIQIKQDHVSDEDSAACSLDSSWVQWNLEMLSAMHDAMCGRALDAQEKTNKWLKNWPNAPAFERGVVLGVHGASCIQSLDFKVARKVLREAKREFSLCEAEYGVSWMSFMYALVLIKQGQIKESKHMLECSLNAANEKMGDLSLASALLHLGLGYACYVMNNLEEARLHLDKGFLSIEEHGHIETVHIAFLTKSNLLLRDGKSSESMSLLYDAENFGRRLHLSHYNTAIAVERIRRLIIAGKAVEANELFVEYGYSDIEGNQKIYTAYERILIEVLGVRLLLENMVYDEVISASSLLIERCQRSGIFLENVSLSIIQIRAYFEKGQVNKSYRLLNKLIESAATEKLLSVFLEEQTYLAPLWADLFKRYDDNRSVEQNSPLVIFVDELRGALEFNKRPLTEQKPEQDKQFVIKESLSKKEREILIYLDQGLSNKELASTLFVSVSTIKWHLTHIYSKLGVKNRVEAIKAFQRE